MCIRDRPFFLGGDGPFVLLGPAPTQGVAEWKGRAHLLAYELRVCVANLDCALHSAAPSFAERGVRCSSSPGICAASRQPRPTTRVGPTSHSRAREASKAADLREARPSPARVRTAIPRYLCVLPFCCDAIYRSVCHTCFACFAFLCSATLPLPPLVFVV